MYLRISTVPGCIVVWLLNMPTDALRSHRLLCHARPFAGPGLMLIFAAVNEEAVKPAQTATPVVDENLKLGKLRQKGHLKDMQFS
jgi:hypothetical protein